MNNLSCTANYTRS